MAAGFRVLSKYVGPVKLCVFDWAGKFTIPSSVKFISKISQKSRESLFSLMTISQIIFMIGQVTEKNLMDKTFSKLIQQTINFTFKVCFVLFGTTQ